MFQRRKSKSPPDKGDSMDNPEGDRLEGEEWDDIGEDEEGTGAD